jgi:hypothetical protein
VRRALSTLVSQVLGHNGGIAFVVDKDIEKDSSAYQSTKRKRLKLYD